MHRDERKLNAHRGVEISAHGLKIVEKQKNALNKQNNA
ncbi:hypothetical protein BRPE64_ACDS16200 [Caballeronia insecticola]|uniref:Uncharacterized protein n=1 Tax=Caballeronia insecticola TaxID=758793 RepID=R4WH82_9BURK|nr:hypothetical protein BRPE64_ACDS16200 [Caballeronia insecticola]